MLRRGLTAVASTRSKLSDNARKLFDLAMQSSDFKKMMVMGMGVIAAVYVFAFAVAVYFRKGRHCMIQRDVCIRARHLLQDWCGRSCIRVSKTPQM